MPMLPQVTSRILPLLGLSVTPGSPTGNEDTQSVSFTVLSLDGDSILTPLAPRAAELVNPNPSTLHPKPPTLNPPPSTLHPPPSTPNPKPSTLARRRRLRV